MSTPEFAFCLFVLTISVFYAFMLGMAISRFGSETMRAHFLQKGTFQIQAVIFLLLGAGFCAWADHPWMGLSVLFWLSTVILQRLIVDLLPHLAYYVLEESDHQVNLYDYAISKGWNPESRFLNLVIEKGTYVAGIYGPTELLNKRVNVVNNGILGTKRPPRDGYILD